MSYAVWFTKEGIKVIDARDLVNRENAEVLFSIARNSTDNTLQLWKVGWTHAFLKTWSKRLREST